MYFGARLWKGASFYFNPELSGGAGFSQARGIAGFTNGEAFRIGSSEPRIYLARAYYKQKFALGKTYNYLQDDLNQIHEKDFEKQVMIVVGKYSLADYFDCNQYSHDPRVHFQNWSLMSAGAWDYAANTRGYTVGGLIEVKTRLIEFRYGFNAVPKYANGPTLNYQMNQANANTAELQFNYGKGSNIKLLGFYNNAPMGSYDLATKRSDTIDITLTRSLGRSKYGFVLNWQQKINDEVGLFARVSWNDGKNETWAFTEIDQSASMGVSFNGKKWNRENDAFGVAGVVNGISTNHQNYLKNGGYGFIIGDGNLNYKNEIIGEMYYAFKVPKWHLTFSPDYQIVFNPAYNADRKGPLHVLAGRVHLQF